MQKYLNVPYLRIVFSLSNTLLQMKTCYVIFCYRKKVLCDTFLQTKVNLLCDVILFLQKKSYVVLCLIEGHLLYDTLLQTKSCYMYVIHVLCYR